ncbi:tyrosine-type recombinase/integrase [Rhodoferax ferrireducens]|uniref:tyrosine-type recombinase/integrase n=1 Tax=Rhodoferax ferrireducens TaxID=192843 RepID=UPI003BB5AC3B
MASFSQRSNGKWQAKIRRQGWPDQSKAFQTLEAAQQWARATEREMDIGAFINRNDAEKTTFADAAKRYKTEILPSKRGKDRDIYKIDQLVEKFGAYSLASINPAMLSAFRDERLKAVAPQTVVHEINMLSRIFKACAMDWGIALPQGIPTALVRKPPVANARDRRLESGEWELLRAALADCKSQFPLAAVEFAIATAARQSEIASLTWQDVDLSRQTARLRGVNGAVTKNGDTHRDVPLSSSAVAILSGLPKAIKGKVFRVTQNALKLSWQRSVDRARQAHIHAKLREALVKSGLDDRATAAEIRALIYHKKAPRPETLDLLAKIEASDTTLADLHFHDLRHEATSRLAEKLQMHELMKVTGHKSSSMTARYYHPRATDLAQKLG